MSTQTVDVEPQGDSKRRGQWMAEAKGVRRPEINAIKYWRQKKADLLREHEALLDKATAQDRDLSEGEQQWCAQIRGDLGFVDGRITEFQDAQAEAMYKMGMLPSSGGHGQSDLLPTSHSARLTHLQKTPGKSGRLYNDLFPNAGDSAGFASGEEFLRLVASGMTDERIMRLNASTYVEGIPSAGGYVVPEILARE